jgi:transglutaminase/protease-like cytokinesis protein 3
MKNLLITGVLFFQFSLIAQQKVDSVRYKYALRAPKTTDVKYLARYLRAGVSDSKEKTVETFFYWIAQNIGYDVDLMNKKDRIYADIAVLTTLENKKTICSGYSKLLFELCHAVKIECAVINGVARSYTDTKNEGHSWNAVKMNDKWQLIDATWGSGGIDLDKIYHKKIKMKYFFADPNFMIIDHFPDLTEWQKLDEPIGIEQFNSKEWNEKRFRKFNDLMDDTEYETYKSQEKESEEFKTD